MLQPSLHMSRHSAAPFPCAIHQRMAPSLRVHAPLSSSAASYIPAMIDVARLNGQDSRAACMPWPSIVKGEVQSAPVIA